MPEFPWRDRIARHGVHDRLTNDAACARAPPLETALEVSAILATIARTGFFGRDMQTLSARDAKYNFGRLIDMARAEPVTVEKHGRAVVVVLAVEEYERLKAIELERHAKAPQFR